MPKLSDLMTSKMGKTMSEFKSGTLNIGKSKKKVFKRKQAVAIGLSQARKMGAKVPEPKGYENPKQ